MSAQAQIIQHREGLFQPFEQQLFHLEKRLKATTEINFSSLCTLVKKALQLLEFDIYPESKHLPPHPGKDKKLSLVSEVIKHIFTYFDDNITPLAFAKIVYLFTAKNIKYHYDYPWLYEERNNLFEELNEFFINTSAYLVTSKSQFTPEAIAKLINGIALLQLNQTHQYRNTIIMGLLNRAERLFRQQQIFTPQESFMILDGISKASIEISAAPQHSHRSLFLRALIKTALPLLLQDDEPLKLFASTTLTSMRIHYVKQLLPPIFDFAKYGEIFLAVVDELLVQQGCCTDVEIYQHLPKTLLNNNEIYLPLEKKEMVLWGKSNTISIVQEEDETAFDEKESKEASYPNRYPLTILANQIKTIYEENNPRGLVWLIKKFADNLLTELLANEGYEQKGISNAMLNFHPQDVKAFLKVIRKFAFHGVVLDIIPTISKLSQETFRSINLEIIDAALAIELLWINMVFSVITNDPKMAFTREQQRRLFEKITTVDNEEHARELFEIRAMKWYSDGSFTDELSKAMGEKFAKFATSSAPSYVENQCFQSILNSLYHDQQGYLFFDYICTQTGMEIDIAYISPRCRIAINIDGPDHYHIALKVPTLKTLFRNACLTQAGWQSHSVDITISVPATLNSLLQVATLLRRDTELTPTSDLEWKQHILSLKLSQGTEPPEFVRKLHLPKFGAALAQSQVSLLSRTALQSAASSSTIATTISSSSSSVSSRGSSSSQFFHGTKEHKRDSSINRPQQSIRGGAQIMRHQVRKGITPKM